MTRPDESRAPVERPNRQADRDLQAGGEDRPGFDLGGAHDDVGGTDPIPGGPKAGPAKGGRAAGRASGYTDPSGSRSLGDQAGEPGSTSGAGPTDGSRGPR